MERNGKENLWNKYDVHYIQKFLNGTEPNRTENLWNKYDVHVCFSIIILIYKKFLNRTEWNGKSMESISCSCLFLYRYLYIQKFLNGMEQNGKSME